MDQCGIPSRSSAAKVNLAPSSGRGELTHARSSRHPRSRCSSRRPSFLVGCSLLLLPAAGCERKPLLFPRQRSWARSGAGARARRRGPLDPALAAARRCTPSEAARRPSTPCRHQFKRAGGRDVHALGSTASSAAAANLPRCRSRVQCSTRRRRRRRERSGSALRRRGAVSDAALLLPILVRARPLRFKTCAQSQVKRASEAHEGSSPPPTAAAPSHQQLHLFGLRSACSASAFAPRPPGISTAPRG